MPEHADLGVAVAVGAAAGAGGFALAGPLFAVHLAVVYLILSWLLANYWSEIPDADTWAVNRWNGLLTVLITLSAFGALNARGASLLDGLAYAALVFGVGYGAFLVGLAMVRDAEATARVPGRQKTGSDEG